MTEFVKQAVFFGGAFTLILSLGALIRPARTLANLSLAILCISTSVMYLYLYLMLAGIVLSPPLLNHMYVPWVYFLGPAMYVLFMSTIKEGYVFNRNRLMFIPGAALFAILPICYLLDPSLFQASPLQYFSSQETGLAERFLILGFLINGFYYFTIFIRSIRVFRPDSLRREPGARVMLGVLIVSGMLTSLVVAAYIFRSFATLLWSAFAMTLFTSASYLAAQRVPSIFQRIGPAVREAYRNSRLSSVDVDALDHRLNQLMSLDKVYHEEDLTLAKLAEILEIKPHQLSEFLNTRRQMNFSRFINTYRAEEAARILLKERDANVLSVAFQVGFNSKATFNLAFKSILGVSPREFVRDAEQGSKDRLRQARRSRQKAEKAERPGS
ncbi:MAG: helix-turn-helix domain-containing protein [Spirochaetia bacterium]|nr:helix-turn-helix domain-containing protein [Spirochaetia bacterium]